MRRRTLAPLLLASLLAACGGGGGGEAAPPKDTAPAQDTRQQLLEDVAARVIHPTYARVTDAAGSLESAAQAWAEAPSPATEAAAQASFKEVARTWQEAEVFQIGPAGVQGTVAGGQGLRDAIYSWPLTNPCRVDQVLVDGDYADLDALAQEQINVLGLDALEYLLFHPADGNACPPNSRINRDGLWGALSGAEREQRRAAYGYALAQLLRRDAGALRDAWAEGGAWRQEFTRAGDGSAAYPTRQAALNALSDALFYIEKEARDMKLAQPAGLMGCDADTCPEALEAPRSRLSRDLLLANLRGFQAVFLGGAPGDHGVGFDDLLRAVGADDVAADMEDAIARSIAAVEALPPLEDALTSDLEQVRAAFLVLQELTTLFKTDFITVLDLELPQRAEGDND